jgi:dTDP-D-glucose 4,6-dehydratase
MESKDTHNILVIGGAGYVGLAFLNKLVKHPDVSVTVYDKFYYNTQPYMHKYLRKASGKKHKTWNLIVGDLRNEDWDAFFKTNKLECVSI